MASIHLQGTLVDTLGEIDVGATMTFTHLTNTGETIATTKIDLIIPPDGFYSIDVEYGQIRIDYTTRVTERFIATVIVNSDSTATTIPELLNAAVPVTDPVILEMQGILADAVAAADTSEAFADQLTTTDLIGSVATYDPDTNFRTKGYLASGDGGAGHWVQNGVTAQTVSQTPADLGDALLNDGNGNQWALVGAIVNALSLGLTQTGDNSLQIKACAIGAANKTLYLPAGSYIGKGSNLLNLLSPIKIIGDGMGVSILDITFETPAQAFTSVKFASGNIVFEDFTIKVTGDTTSAVTMAFNATVDNLTFTRFEIDGSDSFDSVDTNLIQGMKVSDTASPTNVKFTDCKIHGVHFGLFTSNTYTGVAKNWSFKGNSFFDNTGDDLEFNSNDRATKNWQKISIVGNFFTEHPSATPESFGVGSDSGQEITIEANHFTNYVGAGVHLEDELKNVVVNANVFINCDTGIECFNDNNSFVEITNNILDGGAGRALLADPSLFPDPNLTLLSNTVGIIAQRPTEGTNTNCIILGNIISNYDLGMSCPSGQTNSISNNTVSLCSAAYNFADNGNFAFRDNTATRCKYSAWGGAASTVIESLIMNECTNILFDSSPSFMITDKLTWSKTALGLTSGLTTEVQMFEMPTRIHGDQSRATAVRNEVTSIIAVAVSDLSYDGATLASVRNMTFAVGGVSLANPMFGDTGSTLDLRVFHSIGSNQAFRVTAEMHSTFVFN